MTKSPPSIWLASRTKAASIRAENTPTDEMAATASTKATNKMRDDARRDCRAQY